MSLRSRSTAVARELGKVVVVALSGGVDSSLSAWLLKEQGYRVIGLYMKNWDSSDEEGISTCPEEEDFKDVQRVGRHLDIPIYHVNFVKQYWQDVFEPFLDGYDRGITPNPDILCNREIKFKRLKEHALKLGADYLATGHYVRSRTCPSTGETMLLSGKDQGKDQSYFLSCVSSRALENVLFPVGEMRKTEVRELAKKAALPTAEKRDSYGICFVGKRDFNQFIDGYLPRKPGNFVRFDDGQCLGPHDSLSFYTIGQGARISGASERYYVVDKNVDTNDVIVAQGKDHPALFSDFVSLRMTSFEWISGSGPPAELLEALQMQCLCRVRYRQSLEPCTVALNLETGHLTAHFDPPQRATTVGQILALYALDGEVCYGGGMIEARG